MIRYQNAHATGLSVTWRLHKSPAFLKKLLP